MVAWHEVPGNQQRQPPSRRDGPKRCPRVTNLNTSLVIFIAHHQSYRPFGTGHVLSLFQALRARLPSLSPYGTKLSCRSTISEHQRSLLIDTSGWNRRIGFDQALQHFDFFRSSQ
jgi:hypothetical protein